MRPALLSVAAVMLVACTSTGEADGPRVTEETLALEPERVVAAIAPALARLGIDELGSEASPAGGTIVRALSTLGTSVAVRADPVLEGGGTHLIVTVNGVQGEELGRYVIDTIREIAERGA